MKPSKVILYLIAALAAGGCWGAILDNQIKDEQIQALQEFQDEVLLREACENAILVGDALTLTDTIFITDHLTEWQQMQLAIAYTESRFNPQAVGKAHDSGVLQLTPIYIREVNRVAGTSYELADAFDIEKAAEIFSRMQDHYNPEHDLEKAIRLHNSSPYYRREVLKNLEFIKQMEAVREAVKTCGK